MREKTPAQENLEYSRGEFQKHVDSCTKCTRYVLCKEGSQLRYRLRDNRARVRREAKTQIAKTYPRFNEQ